MLPSLYSVFRPPSRAGFSETGLKEFRIDDTQLTCSIRPHATRIGSRTRVPQPKTNVLRVEIKEIEHARMP